MGKNIAMLYQKQQYHEAPISKIFGKQGDVCGSELCKTARQALRAGRYSRAGLICIGVMEEYKGNGLAHTLATTLYRRYEERGLKEAFYYPVNEDNHRSRRFAESIGGTGRVLHHCYDKRFGS